MRLNKLFILYSLFGILMASCIKDEAPNAEADITGISFEEDVLANSYIDLNPSYDESQNAYPIRISVKEGTDMTSLAPIFELTPELPSVLPVGVFRTSRLQYDIQSLRKTRPGIVSTPLLPENKRQVTFRPHTTLKR